MIGASQNHVLRVMAKGDARCSMDIMVVVPVDNSNTVVFDVTTGH